MADNEPEVAYAKQHIVELDKWIRLGEEHGIDITDGKALKACIMDMIVSCQLASTVYGAARKAGR